MGKPPVAFLYYVNVFLLLAIEKMKPRRKRTASEAKLTKSHTRPSKKFKSPRIIDKKKWQLESESSPVKHKTSHRKNKCHNNNNQWKCIECNAYNLRAYVFCAQCAAEPPFHLEKTASASKPPTKSFRPIAPLRDIRSKWNTINNNNHNHNKKEKRSAMHAQMGSGYPDHEIQFHHIADINARKYAKYWEKNIRREQNHHLQQLKAFLNQLQNHHKNDQDPFPWKMNGIEIDKESGDTMMVLTVRSNTINKSNYNEFAIGTPVLALCECHLAMDEVTSDINRYFARCVHGVIEETPRKNNKYQLKITVMRDALNTLKPYKNNAKDEGDNGWLSFDCFTHEQTQCHWILHVNHLSFYEKQLKHLDIFCNASIYQMPYQIFDYLYNANDAWMRDMQCLQISSDYKLNPSQQSAIAKALTYPISLIKGPPGTGKTYALAMLSRVILQHQLKEDHELIVITAHSHSACDRILDTLAKWMDPRRLTRFGAINKIDTHLRKHSFKILLKKHAEYKEYLKFKRQGFADQAKEKLMLLAKNILIDDIDVVIATCYGCLSPFLMQNDIIVSHLILDEATQIIESEQLIPMNLLRDKRSWNANSTYPREDDDISEFDKRIIMIGDPKQLCPVVESRDAIENGYSISMFERLLSSSSIPDICTQIKAIAKEKRKQELLLNTKDIIQDMAIGFCAASHVLRNEEEYKEKQETIQDMIDQENQTKKAKLKLKLQHNTPNEGSLMNYTMLNEQYRMTPFMMRFCNEQFYDSLIDTGTGEGYVIQGVDWTDSQQSLMLVSLDYSQQIKTRAMSYYNLDECDYIYDMVCNVLTSNKGRIEAKDIGIIAMHRAQVHHMKIVFAKNSKYKKVVQDVEIHTVDGFQGKEKKLIVLSFVRTDHSATSFLANPQRCNVALTRAKYGLVIVAQLQQLKANSMWRKFATFAEHHQVIKVMHSRS
eukprot:727606_1